jgi:hypothetical protein
MWWLPWITVNPSWSSSSRSSPNYWRNFDITNYQAFQACADLWIGRRLPTIYELCPSWVWDWYNGFRWYCYNYETIRDALGLQSSSYWSSTERTSDDAQRMFVSIVSLSWQSKGQENHHVVCLHD